MKDMMRSLKRLTFCRILMPALLTGLALLTASAIMPVYAAVNAWTSNGPYGGYISSLAVDPSNPSTLYAGTDGGGGFKSTEDPLWRKATEAVSLAKDTVASRIVTRTTVFEGNGKMMESTGEVQTLTGWDGARPLMKKETKKDVVKKSGITVSASVTPRDNPFYASLQGLVTYKRIGEKTLDGKNCVRFQFEELPKPGDKGGHGPRIGIAWVEKGTGFPVKVEYHPKKLPRHVSVYTTIILFQRRQDGSSVPTEVRFEIKGGFLFTKRVVELHQWLSGWTAGPATKKSSHKAHHQIPQKSRVSGGNGGK